MIKEIKRPIDHLNIFCPMCKLEKRTLHFSHGRDEEIEEYICILEKLIGNEPCMLWHWNVCPLRKEYKIISSRQKDSLL